MHGKVPSRRNSVTRAVWVEVLAGGVEVSDRLIERRCVGGVDAGEILVELEVGSDVAFYKESGLVDCKGDNERV
jgi:hypothetical protein